MRLALLTVAMLAACSTTPDAAPSLLPATASPVPLPYLLNDAVYGGVPNEMVVLTEPNAPAALYVSGRNTGRTCPALLSPACLTIGGALFLGQGTADGEGVMVINGNAPSGYSKDTVYFQVASLLASGGAISQEIALPYYDTCAPPVVTTIEDGATGVPVDTDFVATWADPVAAWQAFDLDGIELATGDASPFERGVAALDLGLDHDTTYTLTLTDPCGGATSISFTTEAAPSFGDTLVGRGWAMDFSQAQITDPASLDAYTADLLTAITSTLVIGVVAHDAGGQTLDFALGEGVGTAPAITQDVCAETTPFPGADFSGDPVVTTAFSTPELADLLDYAILTGTFSADGATLDPVVVRAWVPALTAAELAGLTGFDEATVCALFPFFASGVSCVTCPVSGAKCIDVTLEGITGDEIGDNFTEITADAVLGNPACAAP